MPKRSKWVVQKSEVVADHGMVTAMYPQAAEAGIEVLQQGGNAVDAAVAAGFAIGVVEPFNSGLGGIAALVYYEAKTGKTYVVDGTSTLPKKIRPEMFELDDSSRPTGVYGWPAVKEDANNTGYLAAAVPGTPACLGEALARFGRLKLPDVLAPAIRFAEDGYDLDYYVALGFACNQHRLQRFPESRKTFFRPDGSCYVAPMLGMEPDRFRQPVLARTLRRLAERGVQDIYRGETARLIAEDMAANGGLVTEEDLADYSVRVWEPGLVGSYRGCTTVQQPQNNGAPTVLEMLNILEGYNLAALGHNSVEALHLIAEAQRRAFVDRFAHLGDPALFPVPYDGMVSKEFAAARRQTIDAHRADPDAVPGDPWPFDPQRSPVAATPAGQAAGESMTTHLTVVDGDRNMVALTSTLGGHFGCGVVVKDAGIVLNNGTMWFDPRPGRINSIGPGKRILWAGTPTLVLKDGKPLFAVGSPGGRKVLTAILQSILNVVDYGMSAQAAVSAPRIHSEGRETLIDGRLGEQIIDGLRTLGHVLNVKEESFSSSYFARPNGILVDPATGKLRSGVNQYKPATAIGI